MSYRYGESIFPKYWLKRQGTCVIPMFPASRAEGFCDSLGLDTVLTDLYNS